MRPNNMWMNCLLRGSVAALCLAFFSCNMSQTDWVNHGEWYYRNESSHLLHIEGVIYYYYAGTCECFTIPSGETHNIKTTIDGPKYVPAEALPCPFIPLIEADDKPCRITIDDGIPIRIELGESIRNRANYTVEKTGGNRYSFTFVFTDENLAELMQ